MAIRAICRHGYRPVLVTGRGIDEAEERLDDYAVAGVVAEYGAMVSSHFGRVCLLTPQERDQLDTVRRILQSDPRVRLDPSRHASLRCVAGKNSHAAADAVRAVEEATRGLSVPFQLIGGDAQVDVVVARITKATGLRRLCEDLGEHDIVLAVGDTDADLPMLAMAKLAIVPAHAAAAARLAARRVTAHPYQRGLAEAVEDLVGHRPGDCERCEAPVFTRDARLLHRVLSAASSSRRHMMIELATLTIMARVPAARNTAR
jgi:hydroxymethylpyrimidine pyrophosphatase-like HAD family hydrolase